MNIIYTRNGEIYPIESMEDLANLIYTEVGEDAYHIFQDYIKTHTREYVKANSDLGNYEMSLESNARAFSDLLDTLEPMSEYLEQAQRMDRNKLLNATRHMIKLIHNQI